MSSVTVTWSWPPPETRKTWFNLLLSPVGRGSWSKQAGTARLTSSRSELFQLSEHNHEEEPDLICFWAGFQVSVESPLLAYSQGSCGLLVKEQGAAQTLRLCCAGQCENAASISHYGEMAWPMKKRGLLSALALTVC